MRSRYGRAAAGLLVEVKCSAAAGLMQEMLEQIDTGERGRALMTLMQILRSDHHIFCSRRWSGDCSSAVTLDGF